MQMQDRSFLGDQVKATGQRKLEVGREKVQVVRV